MADQIETNEVEETPEFTLGDAISGAFDIEEQPEEEAPEEETPEEAEEEETPEAEVEELEEELDMGQVIGNAASIALDPEHELYEDAVAVLQEYAPELAERMGLGAEEDDGEFELDEEPENDAIAELQAQLDEMRNAQSERDQQIEQEQQAAEDAAAQEAFRADLLAVAGEDTPEAFDEMNPQQQLAAAALLGLDGLADDPKEAFTNLMKDRDAAMIQNAIDEYAAGKGTVKPTPPTSRNASTHTQEPASLASIVEASFQSNGVSG